MIERRYAADPCADDNGCIGSRQEVFGQPRHGDGLTGSDQRELRERIEPSQCPAVKMGRRVIPLHLRRPSHVEGVKPRADQIARPTHPLKNGVGECRHANTRG